MSNLKNDHVVLVNVNFRGLGRLRDHLSGPIVECSVEALRPILIIRISIWPGC